MWVGGWCRERERDLRCVCSGGGVILWYSVYLYCDNNDVGGVCGAVATDFDL